ncbi:MAG TPA: hypothetical protein VFK41_12090 [Nocardioidaceae bacterium]|nr:hypothetical protein [Nocardioidaceae bacterium]
MINQADAQRFRAVVSYRNGRVVASRARTINVWSWTPLSSFPDYYKTNGINDFAISNFGMNGTQYIGWFTIGTYGTWEERLTVGRHCTRMRGDFGVQDKSADGSSGAFLVTNVDTGAVLYQSPALTPGMVARADFPMPSPYRISIQATDTSLEELVSYPAIGSPELLCRNLDG